MDKITKIRDTFLVSAAFPQIGYHKRNKTQWAVPLPETYISEIMLEEAPKPLDLQKRPHRHHRSQSAYSVD